jgi:hypothetical protein
MRYEAMQQKGSALWLLAVGTEDTLEISLLRPTPDFSYTYSFVPTYKESACRQRNPNPQDVPRNRCPNGYDFLPWPAVGQPCAGCKIGYVTNRKP